MKNSPGILLLFRTLSCNFGIGRRW